ncbi:sensor histidine kinase [Psychroserpens sp.]
MSKLDTLIDNKIAQNIFIWVFLYIIFLGAVQADNRYMTAFIIVLLLAPPIYINNLIILPFFKTNKFLFFSLFVVNLSLFTTLFVYILNLSLEAEFKISMFINFSGIMILALVFGAAIKMARDSFARRQQEKEAELKLLKSQLNPHFLFNTLNNLYGLSVVKSDKLPSLMLKLSDLLRYSLYDTKEMYVPLEKEIQYLKNYMSLEKIRLEDKTEISFNKTGNTSSLKIAPMLLIVFVENAFKHLGISKNNKNNVLVNLITEDEKLTFKCTNTIDETKAQEQNLEKGKSGIGLQNAKKRLHLLYPNMHELTIKKENENHIVQLILNF